METSKANRSADEAFEAALAQRLWRLDRRQFLKAAVAAGVSVAALEAVLAACASQSTSAGAKQGGQLSVGFFEEPDSLDPAFSSDDGSIEVFNHVFDTLVRRQNATQISPGLAERWEVNPDGSQFTFHLRKDVKFHDGSVFDATAVKQHFDRSIDPATQSHYAASLLGPYDSTQVIDSHTVLVKFKTPYAPFLNSASQSVLGIPAPSSISAVAEHPIGTGFMKFVEWKRQDHITLARNPDYTWGPSFAAHQGPAYLDKIVFQMLPDDSSRVLALQSGQVDLIESVPGPQTAALKGSYSVTFGFPPGTPYMIIMNTKKFPTDDPAVREAMLRAVDRSSLIKSATFDTAKACEGPLNQFVPFYSKSIEGLYPLDPNRAKQVLESAGWTQGANGIRVKQGKTLSVTWQSDPYAATFDELVQSQWKSVGIDVVIKRGTNPAKRQAMTDGAVNIGLTGWTDDDPSILWLLFDSANLGGWNWARLSSPNLDAAIEKGAAVSSDSARAAAYATAQMLIMQNKLGVPLFTPPKSFALNSKKFGPSTVADWTGYLWLYDVHQV